MFCWYCVDGGVLSSSFSEGIIIHTSFEDESARVLFQKLQVGDGLSPQPHPTLPCFFDWHILVQYTHDDYSEHTKIVQSTPHPQLEDEHHELPPLTSGILQGLTATQSLLTLGWSCLESIFHCSVFALSEQIKAGREWCLAQLWCLFCLTKLCVMFLLSVKKKRCSIQSQKRKKKGTLNLRQSNWNLSCFIFHRLHEGLCYLGTEYLCLHMLCEDPAMILNGTWFFFLPIVNWMLQKDCILVILYTLCNASN